MMEQTSTWVRIGNTADFPVNTPKPVSLNGQGQDIVVYFDGKTWFAFERACPHKGSNLDGAKYFNNTINCPHHDVSFNMTTGEIISDGGFLQLCNLKVFPVKTEGQDVLVHPRNRTVDSWDRGIEM